MSVEKFFKSYWKLMLFSFVAVTVASLSSPFYPYNFYGDTNAWFTVGRGMCEGKLPYADFVDHKGPILYFLYYLLALLGNNTFLGIYLFEIVCSISVIVSLYKSLELLDSSQPELLSMLGLLVFLCSSGYGYGGTVEIYTMALVMPGIYLFFRNSVLSLDISYAESCFLGIAAGIVFWMKFNLSVLVLLPFVYMVGIKCISDRQKEVISPLLFAVGSFFLVYGGVYWYCDVTGILEQMKLQYFFYNLNDNPNGFSLLTVLKGIPDTVISVLRGFGVGTCLIVLGFLWSGKEKYRDVRKFSMVYLAVAGAMLCLNRFHFLYYTVILMPLIVLGLYVLGEKVLSKSVRVMPLAGVLAIGIFLPMMFSQSFDTVRMSKAQEYGLSKIAPHILERKDSTLLCFGMMDEGFYYLFDKKPIVRNFFKCNLSEPQYRKAYLDETFKVVSAHKADYILTYDEDHNLEKYGYRLIEKVSLLNNNRLIAYRLYESPVAKR